MKWETVIGLEIHVQLKTNSKIFSGAATAYGAAPNSQACAVDLALPGVLPVMNREAARKAIKFGLAIDAKINRRSIFARKNYFYPDLPKGYQISQFELPIVGRGQLTITVDGEQKEIGITRAHLEEDAGKSLHEEFHNLSGIDLNRAGTALIEIVSEPDMRSAAEAVAYLKKIHTLVRYLEISDGNMQEGSFRCDANVSIRPLGEATLGTRTELKNINSFRFVEKAIEFEIERQIDILEGGATVQQETRLYDPGKDETRPMRTKDDAHDYRYFPDPDLPPLVVDEVFLDAIKAELPELPDSKLQRFEQSYGLTNEQAAQLTADKATADYFESTVAATDASAKIAANWVMGELSAQLNESNIDISDAPVTSQMLGQLLSRIEDGTISGKIAKDVFVEIWNGNGTVDEIIKQNGLTQITDSDEIANIIDEILSRSESQIEQYKSGQHKVIGYFVGQVMQATKGKANPQQVNKILKSKLEN